MIKEKLKSWYGGSVGLAASSVLLSDVYSKHSSSQDLCPSMLFIHMLVCWAMFASACSRKRKIQKTQGVRGRCF